MLKAVFDLSGELKLCPHCLRLNSAAVPFLTSSAAMVRQGQCFLVSFSLTDLAFWMVFRDLARFSTVTSRQISLFSGDTPSIWYSSKKLACRGRQTHGLVRLCSPFVLSPNPFPSD